MPKQERLTAPSGMAGLVRYYEEEKSIIKLKPEHVAFLVSGLIVVEIILSMFI